MKLLRETTDGSVLFWCPGCDGAHHVNVSEAPNKPRWGWNGSLDKPTFTPSIKVSYYEGDTVSGVCHSFVTDGRIQFCGDSTHALAGQTVDLPQWESVFEN